MKFDIAGDPDLEGDVCCAFACQGDGSENILAVIKNTFEVSKHFEGGTSLASFTTFKGAVPGLAGFEGQIMRAFVNAAHDVNSSSYFAATVLTDRPIPFEHKFAKLLHPPLTLTPMVIFYGGIDTFATMVKQGQNVAGYSYVIVLVLDNDPQVI